MRRPTLPDPSPEWLASLDEATLHQALLARVEAAWQLCCQYHPDLPRPKVWCDLRGKCAGQAHYGRGGLRFNPVLYAENRHAFLTEVVPHEMAHWLVRHLRDGRQAKPHGHEWRTVMERLFGLEANVTHSFDTRRASPTPYRYHCGCQAHFFTSRRHSLARKGRRYRCLSCAETLVYQSFVENEKRATNG
ncbi:SprT-like domain-containing protein [Billgrantia bachuensis]|uniref:Metallopeptidase n=1 Tax=Billgrantia bachuensis TaxID=2717286 RepID=A0ABX0PRE3_9GAMM|nr:SprT-like domain-containing protein [Halomonas bachuensis]NIC04688.1 metallopeptidase [Halomonas bachuensis]